MCLLEHIIFYYILIYVYAFNIFFKKSQYKINEICIVTKLKFVVLRKIVKIDRNR